jgi:hypothetical protein
MTIARPKLQETKTTTIGSKVGPVFMSAYVGIAGGLTIMIQPDETPADLQLRSNAELLEIHECLRSVGQ